MVLYAAPTVAGAMVEILVHYAAIPTGMCQSQLDIPDDVSIGHPPPGSLPAGWARDVNLTRNLGSVWYRQQSSAVLIVPSSVAHGEKNYLLNVQHPAFGRIRFSSPKTFEFDERLK